MSSGDEAGGSSSGKKRKTQRACDYCRRRKIKCDGDQSIGSQCSKCVSRKTECTYFDAIQKTTYPRGYVENLEQRLERVEKLLGGSLHTDALEIDVESPDTSFPPRSASSLAGSSDPMHGRTPSSTTAPTPNFIELPVTAPYPAVENDDNQGVLEGSSKLSTDMPAFRYHGKCSTTALIHAVNDLKRMTLESAGQSPRPRPRRGSNRPSFLRPMLEDSMPVFTDFPPDDLLDALVDIYFRNVNDHLPLLHEPTFKKALEDGLHESNGDFGATVLLVCANGARYSADSRVLFGESEDRQSAGWKWFHQVQTARKLLFAPARLYDLQVYVLMDIYLQNSKTPQGAWSLVAMGIRAAVDVGAHRKHMYSATPSVEEELWKRAFWVLVIADWQISYRSGRLPCIHDEDIDLALPTECDDEYWTTADGQPSFQQPPGKPSKISAFNCLIRLSRIMTVAHRTFYAVSSPLIHGPRGPEWKLRVVTELDSALNRWVDSLPIHLRWDPDRTDTLFLTQSATLFAYYYQQQIAVHRPFITSRSPAPANFPSLTICTNAARSCIRVMDVLHNRTGNAHYRNASAIFISGLVLMMNVWNERRSGRQIVGIQRDVALVEKCGVMMRALVDQVNVAEYICYHLDDMVQDAKSPPRIDASSSGTAAKPPSPPRAPEFALSITSATSPTPGGSADASPSGTDLSAMPSPLPLTTADLGRGFPTAPAQATLSPYDAAFGLEAGGSALPAWTFGDAMTSLASGAAAAEPHAPAQLADGGADMDMDGLLPEYLFVNDVMSAWASGQPSQFGWDDWSAFLGDGGGPTQEHGQGHGQGHGHG